MVGFTNTIPVVLVDASFSWFFLDTSSSSSSLAVQVVHASKRCVAASSSGYSSWFGEVVVGVGVVLVLVWMTRHRCKFGTYDSGKYCVPDPGRPTILKPPDVVCVHPFTSTIAGLRRQRFNSRRAAETSIMK